MVKNTILYLIVDLVTVINYTVIVRNLKMRIKTTKAVYVSWELAKPGKYHYNPQRTLEDFEK